MVERRKRFSPAKSPSGFKRFSDWIEVITGEHGQKASLARYAGVTPQGVNKWTGKYVPLPPVLEKVAEWAQVSYAELMALGDRTRGGPAQARARESGQKSDVPASERLAELREELEDLLGGKVEIRLLPRGEATSTRTKKIPR